MKIFPCYRHPRLRNSFQMMIEVTTTMKLRIALSQISFRNSSSLPLPQGGVKQNPSLLPRHSNQMGVHVQTHVTPQTQEVEAPNLPLNPSLRVWLASSQGIVDRLKVLLVPCGQWLIVEILRTVIVDRKREKECLGTFSRRKSKSTMARLLKIIIHLVGHFNFLIHRSRHPFWIMSKWLWIFSNQNCIYIYQPNRLYIAI